MSVCIRTICSEARQKKMLSSQEFPLCYNKNSLYITYSLTVCCRKISNQQNWNSQKQHSEQITGVGKSTSCIYCFLRQTSARFSLQISTWLVEGQSSGNRIIENEKTTPKECFWLKIKSPSSFCSVLFCAQLLTTKIRKPIAVENIEFLR